MRPIIKEKMDESDALKQDTINIVNQRSLQHMQGRIQTRWGSCGVCVQIQLTNKRVPRLSLVALCHLAKPSSTVMQPITRHR